jgi:hypothetical protein
MTEHVDLERLAEARPAAPESLVGGVTMWNPPTSPRTPREALEAAISAAIDLLDSAEMLDIDLEDGADLEGEDVDLEPNLGAPESLGKGGRAGDQTSWASGSAIDDCEADNSDIEPSLGSVGSCYGQSIPQTMWATGLDNDAEGDEHDGAEPDPDGEPSHGSTSSIDQDRAWRASSDFSGSGEGEGEPSLGWPNMPPGRGHPEAAMRGYDDDREQDIADQPHDDYGEAEPEDWCDAWEGLGREQVAMRTAATRLSEVVVRIRAAGEAQPGPVPGVVDIIGPASLSGEMATIKSLPRTPPTRGAPGGAP